MGETTLSFYLPFEIVDDGEYQVSIEGREASLNIKREQRCNEDFEKLSGFAVEGTGSVTITRDPWGISGFTRVVVRIPRYVPFEECRLEAQRYLNRLIQVWRFFTRYHWHSRGETKERSNFRFRSLQQILLPVKDDRTEQGDCKYSSGLV